MINVSSTFSIKNPCNYYVLLWILYYLQGTLIPQGGLIGRAIIALFLLISIYHLIKVNTYADKPQFIEAINLLVILVTIYGVVRILSGVEIYRNSGVLQNPTTYIKSYYISLLPVYTMYNYSRKGYLNERWLFSWSFIFLAFLIFRYYSSESIAYRLLALKGIDSELLTNNTGYLFVSFLCVLPFLNHKPLLQYSMLLICGIFVIQSAKRGAVICFVVCLLFFLLYKLRSAKNFKKLIIIVLSCICFLGIYSFYNSLITTNLEYSDRFILAMDNTSGRNDIYDFFITYLSKNLNVLNILFGRGADATIVLSGNYAHNDWLEFAVDMGLLGVSAFVFFFIRFYQFMKRTPPTDMVRIVVLLSFVPCVLKSFFSMSIGDFQLFEWAALAICMNNQSGLSISRLS